MYIISNRRGNKMILFINACVRSESRTKRLADNLLKRLCKAKALYYVTTSGGLNTPDDFGFGYIKALSQSFYNIDKVEQLLQETYNLACYQYNQLQEEINKILT